MYVLLLLFLLSGLADPGNNVTSIFFIDSKDASICVTI